MKRQILIAGAVAILLTAGSVLAVPSNQNGCGPSGGQPKKCTAAPEIDAGAGGSTIALLVGCLLLAAEKRRRSS